MGFLLRTCPYLRIFFLYFFFLIPTLFSEPLKKFKIVIDPGHGGIKQTPYEIYGDKYDTVSGRYLEPYKNGAIFKDRTEMEIVLDIARETQELLELTKTKKGFKKFQTYIRLFSDSETPWVRIESSLTRSDSYTDRNYREKDDKNDPYRLYDFPDFSTGNMKEGRISFINREEPHLVLSLHINDGGPRANPDSGGMGVVLTPSYRTFELLKNISEKQVPPEQFTSSPWSNWLVFEKGYSRLESAIADAWIYFHGYWPDKEGTKTNLERFEGYRYNMVTWRYRDENGWEDKVSQSDTPYAYDHDQFKAVGPYWERERGKPEFLKREKGPEGFGGDNHYAGMELLRFLQYGLRLQSDDSEPYKSPNPILGPYVSTYSLPALVNAISAYLELGDIRSDKDMYFLTKKKKKTAISLAVGIYSLFVGLEIRKKEIPSLPKGKRLEFEKYVHKNGKSYFKDLQERESEK